MCLCFVFLTFFYGGEAPFTSQCRRRGLTGGATPVKLKCFAIIWWNAVTLTNNKQQTTMQLLIKCQGFKHLQPSEFTMDVVPSETIGAIATRLEKITDVPAAKLSVITGLILGNPLGSFKKLDKGVNVSDHGLRHGSTLMVFIPVGQQDSSSDIVVAAAPAQQQQPKSRSVCVGRAEYRASASEPIKSGDIMAVMGDKADKKSKTTLLFEGVEYANAQEWLAKAFKNSGRSCCVQFEKSQAVGNTPRPTRYVPPSSKNKFGYYA